MRLPLNLNLVALSVFVSGASFVSGQATNGAVELAAARQVFDGTMLPKVEVTTFANSDSLFPVGIAWCGGEVKVFQKSDRSLGNIRFKADGQEFDLYDYLADDRVAGLLILKDGKVVMEDYELGIGPETRWISYSMAKSISSTLVGAAIKQGLIASIDDPVTKYVPGLRGGVYDAVSVRNLLEMGSGVKWDETYTDPKSDRRKLLDIQLEGKPGGIVAFMKALPRAGTPGTIWNYSTGESFLVGAVIEGAVHKPLATYLSETLWSKLGMERDATWWLESAGGMGLAGSGLGATLRDYGRFAQFVCDDGVVAGKRIVPEGWFAEAGKAHKFGNKSEDYGYLWWPLPKGDPIHEGAFQAIGIFGQHMYINRREKLAIVVLSARPKPDLASSPVPDEPFFAAVARSLE